MLPCCYVKESSILFHRSTILHWKGVEVVYDSVGKKHLLCGNFYYYCSFLFYFLCLFVVISVCLHNLHNNFESIYVNKQTRIKPEKQQHLEKNMINTNTHFLGFVY